MSFNTSALSTYTEKSKEVLYNGIFTSNNFGTYKVFSGINGSQYVNFIDVTANEQSSACGLDSSGSTTLSQKMLTVGDFSFVNDLCMRDIDGFAFPTVPGVVYDNIETQVMDAIIADTYQEVKKRIDKSMWVGTTSGGYLIDGFVAKASACTDAQSLTTYTATNLALTAATADTIDNIFQEFIDNMTQDMLNGGVIVIHVPFKYYQLYTTWKSNNIAPATMTGEGSVGLVEQWLNGREGQVKLRLEAGLVDTDYMLATPDFNLAYGTDLPQEIDMFSNARFEYDNISRKIYHFLDFRLGVLILDCSKVIKNF